MSFGTLSETSIKRRDLFQSIRLRHWHRICHTCRMQEVERQTYGTDHYHVADLIEFAIYFRVEDDLPLVGVLLHGKWFGSSFCSI